MEWCLFSRAKNQNTRNQKQAHDAVDDRPGKRFAEVSRNSDSSYSPDARADFLNRTHERVGEQCQPESAESKLSASLRVGCNTARVVVGGAGDQARSDQAQVCQDGIAIRNRSAALPRLGGDYIVVAILQLGVVRWLALSSGCASAQVRHGN